METTPGFIIAAPRSKSGKTTATLAVMAALQAAGKTVAPFKAGPDFIDPLWHQVLCGTPSHNLDTFMMGAPLCRHRLHASTPAGATAVVEGVMGLFDGKSGVGGPGSTADLARELGLPVLLVVEAQGMAGSIVPLVAGFRSFARGFSIMGVLANRVGSAQHAALLADVLREHGLPPLLGWLAREEALALTERHLGLVLPGEAPPPGRETLAAALHLDLEALLSAAAAATANAENAKREGGAWEGGDSRAPDGPLAGKRIAVARDAAFCFLYQANLEWLAREGAVVRFFSPLAGEPLPEACDALWLPGGYPELHAAALSGSPTWRGVRRAAARGVPVLAECGGMMALGETLADHDGTVWPMAGVLPIHTRMTSRLAGLGYRQEAGGARGHEFHHSIRDPSSLPPAFRVARGDSGVRLGSVRASYIHWYFPSHPPGCAGWLSGG